MRPLPSTYGCTQTNAKWPSTTRTAGSGSSRSSSKNAGIASRTAAGDGGTCIERWMWTGTFR